MTTENSKNKGEPEDLLGSEPKRAGQAAKLKAEAAAAVGATAASGAAVWVMGTDRSYITIDHHSSPSGEAPFPLQLRDGGLSDFVDPFSSDLESIGSQRAEFSDRLDLGQIKGLLVPGVNVLIGEAGMGKSALAAHLVALAGNGGLYVISGERRRPAGLRTFNAGPGLTGFVAGVADCIDFLASDSPEGGPTVAALDSARGLVNWFRGPLGEQGVPRALGDNLEQPDAAATVLKGALLVVVNLDTYRESVILATLVNMAGSVARTMYITKAVSQPGKLKLTVWWASGESARELGITNVEIPMPDDPSIRSTTTRTGVVHKPGVAFGANAPQALANIGIAEIANMEAFKI